MSEKRVFLIPVFSYMLDAAARACLKALQLDGEGKLP